MKKILLPTLVLITAVMFSTAQAAEQACALVNPVYDNIMAIQPSVKAAIIEMNLADSNSKKQSSLRDAQRLTKNLNDLSGQLLANLDCYSQSGKIQLGVDARTVTEQHLEISRREIELNGHIYLNAQPGSFQHHVNVAEEEAYKAMAKSNAALKVLESVRINK